MSAESLSLSPSAKVFLSTFYGVRMEDVTLLFLPRLLKKSVPRIRQALEMCCLSLSYLRFLAIKIWSPVLIHNNVFLVVSGYFDMDLKAI